MNKISHNAYYYKRLSVWAVVIAVVLMIPLLAMQFIDEISWDPFDFLMLATVLIGIGIAYELVSRKSKKTIYRTAFGIGLIGAFLLIWVNGAVGIIGHEGQDANLLYGAVILVGLVGSLISRFKAKGMSITLFAAALIQILVPVIALIVWPPPSISWAPGITGVFLLSAFFAAMFLVSAFLFRRAALHENLIL